MSLINYGAVIPISISTSAKTGFLLDVNGSSYLVTSKIPYFNPETAILGLYINYNPVKTKLRIKVNEHPADFPFLVMELPDELKSFPVLYPASVDHVSYNNETNIYYGKQVTYAGHMSYGYFASRKDKQPDHLVLNRGIAITGPYPMVKSGIISGMDSMKDPRVYYMSSSLVSRYYSGGPVLDSSGSVIGMLDGYNVCSTNDPYYLDEIDLDYFSVVHSISRLIERL